MSGVQINSVNSGGTFPGSGNIMCSVGCAEEDPGWWSMTWYGSRYLFVKIFCLQNKSMWTAAMHVFQHSCPPLCKSGQSYLRRILSIQQERKYGFCVLSFFLLPPAAGLLKHEPHTSRYMACVNSEVSAP